MSTQKFRRVVLWEIRSWPNYPGTYSRRLGRGRLRKKRRANKLAAYLERRFGHEIYLAPYNVHLPKST